MSVRSAANRLAAQWRHTRSASASRKPRSACRHLKVVAAWRHSARHSATALAALAAAQ